MSKFELGSKEWLEEFDREFAATSARIEEAHAEAGMDEETFEERYERINREHAELKARHESSTKGAPSRPTQRQLHDENHRLHMEEVNRLAIESSQWFFHN